MYGIFTYIWDIDGVNVAKYSSTMEHMGDKLGKDYACEHDFKDFARLLIRTYQDNNQSQL